jgi:signal transduction histidine kinase
MKEMDGKIWVESEGQGEGATFVLQLPAVTHS